MLLSLTINQAIGTYTSQFSLILTRPTINEGETGQLTQAYKLSHTSTEKSGVVKKISNMVKLRERLSTPIPALYIKAQYLHIQFKHTLEN